jgi:hypothetical protein
VGRPLSDSERSAAIEEFIDQEVLIFAVGLLHGLGFAGALEEAGIGRAELLLGLVTFNLGVEAG